MMSNVNRIGFELPTGYTIRDHIMWSENIIQERGEWITSHVAVSGTGDIPRITVHGFRIVEQRNGRVRMETTVHGKLVGKTVMDPYRYFDTVDEAKYVAAWHSESIICESIDANARYTCK